MASTLVIACGALAREIQQLKRDYGWDHLHLKCIDAALHNRPELIGDRLRATINRHRDDYDEIFVAYADCGTRGEIDRVCFEQNVERLPGAHCYQFFAGDERFARLGDEEPGTFYLTDFLARHFERLVVGPLGLKRHPELKDVYFGHYRRLVFLSQTRSDVLTIRAKRAAAFLELEFEEVHTGYGQLETRLREHVGRHTRAALRGEHGEEDSRLLA